MFNEKIRYEYTHLMFNDLYKRLQETIQMACCENPGTLKKVTFSEQI